MCRHARAVAANHDLEGRFGRPTGQHDAQKRALIVVIAIVRPLVLISVDVQNRQLVAQLVADEIAERVEEMRVLVVGIRVCENNDTSNVRAPGGKNRMVLITDDQFFRPFKLVGQPCCPLGSVKDRATDDIQANEQSAFMYKREVLLASGLTRNVESMVPLRAFKVREMILPHLKALPRIATVVPFVVAQNYENGGVRQTQNRFDRGVLAENASLVFRRFSDIANVDNKLSILWDVLHLLFQLDLLPLRIRGISNGVKYSCCRRRRRVYVCEILGGVRCWE